MAGQRRAGRCCQRGIESRLQTHRHRSHVRSSPPLTPIHQPDSTLTTTQLRHRARSRKSNQEKRHPPLRNLHHHKAMEQLPPPRRRSPRPRRLPRRPRNRLPRPLPNALALTLRPRLQHDTQKGRENASRRHRLHRHLEGNGSNAQKRQNARNRNLQLLECRARKIVEEL